MLCATKQKLLNAYSASALRYSDAVHVLAEDVGYSSDEELERFDQQNRAVQAARVKCREALKDLERHRVDHDC